MGDYISTAVKQEKAVLVSIIGKNQSKEQAEEYLAELDFLVETVGAKAIRAFTQKLERPDSRTYVGKGKVEEIKDFLQEHETDLLVFDDDLTPSQIRNLENIFKCKIYDRSLLILDIFLKRAQTAQAKTQVELARYQYLMPRLTRMWTHLERQRGGTGTRGGAGEKEIETDRRVIRDQISFLKKKLEKIDLQDKNRRKNRSNIVRVSLVGYTNVGKSTLMRQLSKSDVYAEDKLFATVDTTIRKVVIDRIPFLLSDTVGFIRKLPHHLIESFKSTLDEVREADILLHVVDISHPAFREQISIVNSTLADIGAVDKPTIMVYNKIDQFNPAAEELTEFQDELNDFQIDEELNEEPSLPEKVQQLGKSILAKGDNPVVFLSAIQNFNFDALRKTLMQKVRQRHLTIFPNFLESDDSIEY
jgi:GTP-binding protein HflX